MTRRLPLAALALAIPAVAGAQVIAERGGPAAQPVLMPTPVVPVSAAPVIFRNDHPTPVGYNVPTAVPLAGATTGAVPAAVGYAAAGPAPGAQGGMQVQAVGYSPVVTGQAFPVTLPGGSSQTLPAPLVGPASGFAASTGVQQAQPHAAQQAGYAAARPVVVQGGMVAVSSGGGYQAAVPVNAFGFAVPAASPSPGVQHAPIMSTVLMPATVMTQRTVMPVQRP